MKEQEFDFETWYDIAKDEYKNAGFRGLPIDKDAAQYAYDEGYSPEKYIKEIKDEQ